MLCNVVFLKLFGYVGEKDVLGCLIYEVIFILVDDGSCVCGECVVFKVVCDGVIMYVESEDFLCVDGSSFLV